MANGTKGGGGGPSAESLKIAAQLSSLMSSMAASATKIDDAFASQAQATAKMAENMKQLSTGDLVGQLMEVNQTLKQVAATLSDMKTAGDATFGALNSGSLIVVSSYEQMADAIDESADSMNDARTPAEKLAKALKDNGKDSMSFREKLRKVGNYLEKEFPVASGAALGALSGLRQGFRNITAIGSTLFSFAQGVVGAMFEIGQAIISIPFKLLDGLVGMAKKGMGQISELATALNNIRKQFGDLRGPVASTIQTVARGMSGFSGPAFAVFGNVAERMELLNALFTEGGAALQSFTGEFKKNGGALLGYQRGLGISNEQMGALANNAKSTGRTLTTVLNNITKQSLALGKAFGIDAKLISRDMAAAAADVKHFGGMSEKQLGIAVTYARGLGLELDKVTGVLDAFTTFDEAAEKVSNLNQVFGTQVDAMKLVNSQNTAESIKHLREEFAKAGIDGAKLTRAQRAIIAQNTNLDDSQIQLAFSAKNQGLEMKKIETAAERAERATLAQADAMNKLISQMERVLKAMEAKEGGFFGHFFAGFTDGMQRTGEFRELIMNIQRSLMEVYRAGVQVGRAFVEYFPGIKDFLGALADVFKPERFRRLMNDITSVITGFFKDLGEPGGKASFGDLMDKLKEKFFNFFDQEKGPGSKLLSSFGKIMNAVKVIIAGGISWVMSTLTDFVKSIISVIKEPDKVSGLGTAVNATKGFVSPIGEAFRNGWKTLGPAVKELIGILFEKMMEIVGEFAKKHWGKIALVLFGPAALQALVGAGVPWLVKGLGTILAQASASGMFGKAVQGFATKMGVQVAPKVGKALSTGFVGKAAKGIGLGLAGAGTEAVLGFASEAAYAAGSPKVGATLETAGSTIGLALQGAAIGSFFGPIGMGIGAVGAGAYGLLSSLFSDRVQSAFSGKPDLLDPEAEKTLMQEVGDVAKTAIDTGTGLDEAIQKVVSAQTQKLSKEGKKKLKQMLNDLEMKKQGFTEEAVKEYERQRKAKSIAQRVVELKHKQMYEAAGVSGQKLTPDELIELTQKSSELETVTGQGNLFMDEIYAFAEQKLVDPREAAKQAALRRSMEERGRQMMEVIGETTIDNVEERFRKIKQIGEKVFKEKGSIEEQIGKIRDTLAAINFDIFKDETSATKFQEAIGAISALDQSLGHIKNLVATLGAVPQAFAGLGKASQQGSIMNRFVSSMETVKAGLSDVDVIFKGGKLSTGATVSAFSISGEAIKSIGTAETDLATVAGGLDKIKDAATTLQTAMTSISQKGNALKSSAAALSTAFGGLSEALATIPEAAKAYPPVVAAVGEMLDNIIKIDEALSKVQNVNLKAKLENIAGAQGLGGTTKIKTTVEASKPIEIHAHFTAVVDATKLEAALLESKGSQIKDRVNMLISMAQEISGESENLKVAKNNIKGAGRDALVGHPTSRTNIAPPAVTAAAKAT